MSATYCRSQAEIIADSVKDEAWGFSVGYGGKPGVFIEGISNKHFGFKFLCADTAMRELVALGFSWADAREYLIKLPGASICRISEIIPSSEDFDLLCKLANSSHKTHVPEPEGHPNYQRQYKYPNVHRW